MLVSLSVKNYALIDHLEIDFSNGLSVITGETGAGKSILLGALSLVLGNRADLGSIRNKEEKCVVEAVFDIKNYNLTSLFENLEIDFENNTIIRREILPSGKSRAFINDTPCNLSAVQAIGNRLIDIHSQHQTLELTENEFQLQVIDAVADNKLFLERYRENLKKYNRVTKKLETLKNQQSEAVKEEDYNSFLLKELFDAKLYNGMQEELEAIYEQLNNVEDIREKLAFGNQMLSEDEVGTLAQVNSLKNTLQKLAGFGKKYEELASRIQSVYIELDDVFNEIKEIEENLSSDPELLEKTHIHLQRLYDLQKKHQVTEVEDLIEIRDSLQLKIQDTENLEQEITALEKEMSLLKKALNEIALQLHERRKGAIPKLVSYLEESLAELGMASARFNISLEMEPHFYEHGKDSLAFLFAANKGTGFGELKKVASGGELSRIMLSIKAILASHIKLPTIMFDEIDTGVSGEISNKMGAIMKDMGKYMQVFTITHLPQVAAKGAHHYKVFKSDETAITTTDIKKLNEEERVRELAEMLGGKTLSDSALAHAKQLLN